MLLDAKQDESKFGTQALDGVTPCFQKLSRKFCKTLCPLQFSFRDTLQFQIG